MAESDLHRALKRAACRWLWQHGYAAIAEEVKVPGVGIIDVVGAGKWKSVNPRRAVFEYEPAIDRKHVVFIECKAHRSDFLQDQGRQQQFAFALSERGERLRQKRKHRPRHSSPALGKFDCCLIRPHAHVHYLLTPPKLLRRDEVPRRWGWLTFEEGIVRALKKPTWHEVADVSGVEASIARSLTALRMSSLSRAPLRDASVVDPIHAHATTPLFGSV